MSCVLEISFLLERPQVLVRFSLETKLDVQLSDWGCSASASGPLPDEAEPLGAIVGPYKIKSVEYQRDLARSFRRELCCLRVRKLLSLAGHPASVYRLPNWQKARVPTSLSRRGTPSV